MALSLLPVQVQEPLPAGTNNIGDVDIASALPAGSNVIGDVGINGSLPAGTNNIGDVDIASALPAGTNVIGEVGIDSANNTIQISQSGSENGIQVVAALPAGTNNIGDVDIASALPAGTNTIGKVEIATVGTVKERYEETASIIKNQASTETVQSAAISNGIVGTLKRVRVSSRVGMTAVINKDANGSKTVLDTIYIPGSGGTVEVTFEAVAKNQLTGNVGGTNLFDVEITNDDKNQDAVASAVLIFVEP